MNILDVKEVVKRYESHTALDNVSLEIPAGKVFGLLGPNGAGKTSLIRIINQITAPDSGTVLFEGKPLTPDTINYIGYMPEERGLYKKMEVGEHAIYLAQLKGMSRSTAVTELRAWFEKMDMRGWWKKKIEELSKGMAQKIQFITTVVHRPRLLILDEPFTGFDPINANIVKDELLELQRNGTSIVLSTHRMESVEELCSHIALINKSKVVLHGAVRDIRKQYKADSYTLHYEGSKIALANSLWTGFELLDNKQTEDGNFATIKMLDGARPNDLLQALIPSVEIKSFNENIPSMNDIFITVVGDSNLKTPLQTNE